MVLSIIAGDAFQAISEQGIASLRTNVNEDHYKRTAAVYLQGLLLGNSLSFGQSSKMQSNLRVQVSSIFC